jgi:hypothetical protein
MWFEAVNKIATRAHWKFVYLGKAGCPAPSLTFQNPKGWGRPGAPFLPCERFHEFALQRINQLHPDLVVVTNALQLGVNGRPFTPHQWTKGMQATLARMDIDKNRIAILGNTPAFQKSPAECLQHNPTDIQSCTLPASQAVQSQSNRAEKEAAIHVGARYIDITSWFCSSVCTPVIGNTEVYWDFAHITGTYALQLRGVLDESLGISADS